MNDELAILNKNLRNAKNKLSSLQKEKKDLLADKQSIDEYISNVNSRIKEIVDIGSDLSTVLVNANSSIIVDGSALGGTQLHSLINNLKLSCDILNEIVSICSNESKTIDSKIKQIDSNISSNRIRIYNLERQINNLPSLKII